MRGGATPSCDSVSGGPDHGHMPRSIAEAPLRRGRACTGGGDMSKSGTSVPSASTQRVVAVCVCVCQAEDRGGWWVTNEVLAAQSWHRMNWQVGLGCLIGQLLTSVLDCSCFGYVRSPPSPTLPASSPLVAGGRRAAVLRKVLFRVGSHFCVILVKRQRAATGNGSCLFIAASAAGARGRLPVAARKTYLTQHVSYTP